MNEVLVQYIDKLDAANAKLAESASDIERLREELKRAKDFLSGEFMHVSLGEKFEGRISGYEAAEIVNEILNIGRQVVDGTAQNHEWNDSGGLKIDAAALAQGFEDIRSDLRQIVEGA